MQKERKASSTESSVTFTIPGEFTLYNVYDGLNKRNKYAAGTLKQQEDWRVVAAVRHAFGSDARVMESAYPLDIHIAWYRKTAKADPDGIRFAAKFIFDGMQKSGLIRNDSQKDIRSITDTYHTDKDNPRVVVTLIAAN